MKRPCVSNSRCSKVRAPPPPARGGEIHGQRGVIFAQHRRARPFAAARRKAIGEGHAMIAPAIRAVAGQADARLVMAEIGIVETRRGQEEPPAAATEQCCTAIGIGDLPHIPQVMVGQDRYDVLRGKDRQSGIGLGGDAGKRIGRPMGRGGGCGHDTSVWRRRAGQACWSRSRGCFDRTEKTETAASSISTPHRISTLRGSPPNQD